MSNKINIEYIKNLYLNDKLSVSKISLMTGHNRGTISKYLKKELILIRQVEKKYDINLVLNLYNEGLSMKEIARKLNTSDRVIARYIKQNDINIRDKSHYYGNNRKNHIDESFFRKIDSEEKAYFLGFLYADGNMDKFYKTISITLQENDKYILENFKKLLGYNKELKFRKKKTTTQQNQYVLIFHSKKMCNDLLNLGIKPNKTFDCDFPEFLDEELKRHFVRGFFDGDGWITLTKKYGYKRIGFVGYDKFIDELKNYLEQNNILSIIRNTKNNNKIKILEINKIILVEHFYKLLYNNSTIYLKRKYDKFNNIHE